MKKLETPKKRSDYGISVFLSLDEKEQSLLRELSELDNRKVSNLVTLIIKKWLIDSSTDDAKPKTKKGTVNAK